MRVFYTAVSEWLLENYKISHQTYMYDQRFQREGASGRQIQECENDYFLA